MNACEINPKLRIARQFFQDSNDLSDLDHFLVYRGIVQDVNEILGFGRREPWVTSPDSPQSILQTARTIRQKLSRVGLGCTQLSKKVVVMDKDGTRVLKRVAFYNVGSTDNMKKLKLWLKMDHTVGSNYWMYYLTTKSPFDN